MLTKIVFSSLYALVVLSRGTSSAFADQWNLPTTIDDSNTTISFEVDSTWHLVEGKTAGLSGELHSIDPANPNAVTGEITLPVSRFETGSESRDERMREVLHADTYPTVLFKLSALMGACDSTVLKNEGCSLETASTLTVSGIERPINLSVDVHTTGENITVSGTTTFNWADFGVEDPSILIAKLDPNVSIKFTVTLPKKNSDEGERHAEHSGFP